MPLSSSNINERALSSVVTVETDDEPPADELEGRADAGAVEADSLGVLNATTASATVLVSSTWLLVLPASSPALGDSSRFCTCVGVITVSSAWVTNFAACAGVAETCRFGMEEDCPVVAVESESSTDPGSKGSASLFDIGTAAALRRETHDKSPRNSELSMVKKTTTVVYPVAGVVNTTIVVAFSSGKVVHGPSALSLVLDSARLAIPVLHSRSSFE
jgi:hypothetical protein